jgi:dTDP-L-rhamnose 4-epimerase
MPRDPAALDQSAWEPVCPICAGRIAPLPTHEEIRCRPGSVYAATKLAQEHLCQVVGAAYGLPVVVLRYFNVYGPGQSLRNPYTGLLSTFYARASAGKPIAVFEDGRESRDFVYIDDVVAATRRALLQPALDSGSQVVNVGTGIATSIHELARAIVAAGGWQAPIELTGTYRVGDVRHVFADTRRAERVLGFRAATTLHEGLRRWLRWAEASEAPDATDTAAAELAERGLSRRAGGGSASQR